MANKGTSCAKALQQWETTHGRNPAEEEVVKLVFLVPPIDKMDPAVLNNLVKCTQLSLSSNCIDKIVNLPNLRNLEILSLARNNIKKIGGLDEIGQTLKQLWISYNLIEKLDNLQPCVKLSIFYITNNKIKDWNEYDKLKDLPELSNISCVGNPTHDGITKEDSRFKVLGRLQTLKYIDGQFIDPTMVEKVVAEGIK